MGFVAIPQNMMGTALDELKIQSALIRLNPGMHFDWGGKHNMWHPYQDCKQGVYFEGKHICSMDRGKIPQAPIWSTKMEGCRVRKEDLTYHELTDMFLVEEVEYFVDGSQAKTGWCFVKREKKDRLLWIGWQALCRKIIGKRIPGITAETLGRELGVTIDVHRTDMEDLELKETRSLLVDAAGKDIRL
jgi:hypothetical protein